MACQDNQGIRPSHYECRKGSSYLTNLISSCDKLHHLWNGMECEKVDEGKVVNVVHLYFSKAFDIISHTIFWEKLSSHGLDRCAVHRVKKGPGKEWLGPGSGDEWSYIQLVTIHQWGSLGLNI